MKITEYKIVSNIGDSAATETEKHVGEFIKDGWQPHGSLQVNYTERSDGVDEKIFSQAMVKYELKDDNKGG